MTIHTAQHTSSTKSCWWSIKKVKNIYMIRKIIPSFIYTSPPNYISTSLSTSTLCYSSLYIYFFLWHWCYRRCNLYLLTLLQSWISTPTIVVLIFCVFIHNYLPMSLILIYLPPIFFHRHRHCCIHHYSCTTANITIIP